MGVSAVVAAAAVYGAYESNQAANATADAQTGIAHAQLTQEQIQRQQAQAAAQPNANEIASMQSQLNLTNQDIDRRKQLLDSVDPSIMAAGKQALNLMNGQSAAALAPIQQQRALQRVQLENSLRARLGSGYATSTAGIQALNSFDSQTANTMTNAQSQTLNQFLGISRDVSSQGYGQDFNSLSALTGEAANQSNRMVSAINGTPITNAGAGYMGQLYGAQAQSTNAQNNAGLVTNLANLYGTKSGSNNGVADNSASYDTSNYTGTLSGNSSATTSNPYSLGSDYSY